MRKKKTSKKSFKHPLLALVFAMGFGSGYVYYEDQLPTIFSSETKTPTLNVCFSPEGNCEKLALWAIDSAQKEVLVQA